MCDSVRLLFFFSLQGPYSAGDADFHTPPRRVATHLPTLPHRLNGVQYTPTIDRPPQSTFSLAAGALVPCF
jgi:hypothetical protein